MQHARKPGNLAVNDAASSLALYVRAPDLAGLVVQTSGSECVDQLSRLLSKAKPKDAGTIESSADRVIAETPAPAYPKASELLTKACSLLFEVGESQRGINLGLRVAEWAEAIGDVQTQRRIYNIVGGQYVDIADFASSMKYLELAIVLARRIGDPQIEAACLANVVAVLQEMGHYRQAIIMAGRVSRMIGSSCMMDNLKLQCASNGLFAAHRIGDQAAATLFLKEGELYLHGDVNPLRRVFFERGRVLYMIDQGQGARARTLLDETRSLIASGMTPRIAILLAISSALCEWACGDKARGRQELLALYKETKKSLFYHHFVLQALIKAFSDSDTQSDVSAGLTYARELVEFTTRVKKAKFYRQLKHRRDAADRFDGNRGGGGVGSSTSIIDPFAGSKDWMTATQVGVPTEEEPTKRRELAKHEELTVIHDEMARLRVAGLRREIRTDAVDTAENWAIAAEFFDDETGKHCYRVGHLASLLAREVGMPDAFCVQIEHAARLHDIGKIAVNEVILLKPGPLDAAETAAMRLHTEVGAQILAGSTDATLMMAAEVARSHHEWWNGQGYPQKLSGQSIPISARISAFADVYDALTHARAYKTAWSHERAVDEITRMTGTQFDPHLLQPFRKVLDRYLQDLRNEAIPGFKDMDSNALIASRRRLMDTIAAS